MEPAHFRTRSWPDGEAYSSEYGGGEVVPRPLRRHRTSSTVIDHRDSLGRSTIFLSCPQCGLIMNGKLELRSSCQTSISELREDQPIDAKRAAYPHLTKGPPLPAVPAETFDIQRIPFRAFRDADFMSSTSMRVSYIALVLKICYPRCGAIQGMTFSDVDTMVDFYRTSIHVRLAAPWPATEEEGRALHKRFLGLQHVIFWS